MTRLLDWSAINVWPLVRRSALLGFARCLGPLPSLPFWPNCQAIVPWDVTSITRWWPVSVMSVWPFLSRRA
ncbi:hypothetical protein D3C72_500430 [compost metagenome]